MAGAQIFFEFSGTKKQTQSAIVRIFVSNKSMEVKIWNANAATYISGTFSVLINLQIVIAFWQYGCALINFCHFTLLHAWLWCSVYWFALIHVFYHINHLKIFIEFCQNIPSSINLFYYTLLVWCFIRIDWFALICRNNI